MRGSPDGVINLIHYEDAAALIAAVLEAELAGQLLLGCDNQALSRQQIVDAACQLPEYATTTSPQFMMAANAHTGRSADEKGKVYDNARTRLLTCWQPRWKSFADFAASCKDLKSQ